MDVSESLSIAVSKMPRMPRMKKKLVRQKPLVCSRFAIFIEWVRLVEENLLILTYKTTGHSRQKLLYFIYSPNPLVSNPYNCCIESCIENITIRL